MPPTTARASPGRAAWARRPSSDPARADRRCMSLRKRAAVFGHNAPVWRSMDPEFRDRLCCQVRRRGRRQPSGAISPSAPTSARAPPAARSISTGPGRDHGRRARPTARAAASPSSPRAAFNRPDEQLSRRGTYVELYRVDRHDRGVARRVRAFRQGRRGSRSPARISTPSSSLACARRRSTRKSRVLPLAATPVTDAGQRRSHPGRAVGADGLLPGRRLIVRGARASDEQAVVHQATLVGARIRRRRALQSKSPRRCRSAAARQRGRARQRGAGLAWRNGDADLGAGDASQPSSASS